MARISRALRFPGVDAPIELVSVFMTLTVTSATSVATPPLFAPHRFSVAPMLDWTDRHCRFFLRQLSKRTLLYTEMVTTGAILFGKGDYLGFDEAEHPVALQLGGSDPAALAECARRAQAHGYDEVNLNVGCPSDRVQNGRFGACLMAEPALVAQCVAAMRDAVTIPVTVKTRLGIDDQDSYEFLCALIDQVAAAGCDSFIIHARKAWLKGLSPKENREIPPLDYERAYRLKRDYPQLTISVNGGINSLAACQEHLGQVDGVMVGREAYQNPFMLAEVDQQLFGESYPSPSRADAIAAFIPYVRRQQQAGERPWAMLRHILGLYQGLPGARQWRRHLSTFGPRSEDGAALLEEAMAKFTNR